MLPSATYVIVTFATPEAARKALTAGHVSVRPDLHLPIESLRPRPRPGAAAAKPAAATAPSKGRAAGRTSGAKA